jgi:DNA (cytosine-5)-methyltransferase 1
MANSLPPLKWEAYPRRVLLCNDKLTDFLPRFPIWDDVCTFDGKPWRGIVDVVSQAGSHVPGHFSAAEKAHGIDGERPQECGEKWLASCW